jgi:transcription elongation factor Elf1
MSEYYDHYDAYGVYGYDHNATTLDQNNNIKTFSCSVCKQSKLVLKKSVNDPVFKCDECIENGLQQLSQQQNQGNQETTSWKWFSFF